MFDWDVSVFRDFIDATNYKVVDRWGQEVQGVQEAKKIPIFGVLVRRLVKEKGGRYIISAGKTHVLSERKMIWFGRLEKHEH